MAVGLQRRARPGDGHLHSAAAHDYVELRTAGGIFDAFSTTGGRGDGFGGGGTTFTAPTVFIYASDNVRVPPAMPTGRGGGGGTGSPTCIDGTTLTAPGPASCAGSTPGTRRGR